MIRLPALWIMGTLAVAACTFRAEGEAIASERREIIHDGRTRVYYVHLPPQPDEGRPLPVVLNFHGGGGDALGHERYTRMDTLADEEGFIAVYPAGTSRFR